MIDKKAFRSVNYGLYIVTAQHDGLHAGCVVNTFAQVTSTPAQASIAINKENVTTQAIIDAGVFEVSVLSESAPMELIGQFGFKTSTEIDKYDGVSMATDEAGVDYVAEHAVAHFCLKVLHTLDLGTHILIVGEVIESAILSDEPSMTYAYYHQVKGGKTPARASSFEGEAEPADTEVASAAPRVAWRCKICGHIEYVEELADDYVCPICGMGKEMFERIEL